MRDPLGAMALFTLSLIVLLSGCKKEEETAPDTAPDPPPSTILYTNPDPDITVDHTSDSLLVDINADGIDDVWLRAQLVVDYSVTPPADWFYLKAVALDSSVDVSLGSWSVGYDLLASGDAIHDASYWTNQTLIYGDEDGTIVGPWSVPSPDVTDGFIGTRMGSAGFWNYGWINVYVTTHTLTLKRYAYETALNEAINAGDTGL